ncbi:hypothetical protein PHSC3_000586 [Chlamydiales bacterium STE3]|nr:hypothetical protein PHSC3_000586 [Chlamydiales bacterium STE3]
MVVHLNCSNFFRYFAFHPNSSLLSERDRKIARCATAIFALTLGIGHLFCLIFLFRDLKAASSSTRKVSRVAVNQLTPGAPPSGQAPDSPDAKPIKVPANNINEGVPALNVEGKVSSHSLEERVPPSGKEVPDSKGEEEVSFQNGDENDPAFSPVQPSWDELLKLKERFNVSTTTCDSWLPGVGSDEALHKSGGFLQLLSKEEGEKFLETSLADWLNPNSLQAQRIFPKSFSELDRQVKARMEELDHHFRLFRQIYELEVKDHLYHLTMADLETPWEKSALPLAVCNKTILAHHTLNYRMEPKQWAMIGHRLSSLKRIPVDEKLLEVPLNLTVQQLYSLSGKDLSKIIHVLPDEVLALICDQQIKEMDFSTCRLTAERFRILFPKTSSRIEILSAEQVQDCLPFLNTNDWNAILDEVIQQIDFRRYPLTQEMFDEGFPSYFFMNQLAIERQLSKVKLLTKEQIDACWHLFDKIRISYLSDSQVQLLSLNRFDPNIREDYDRLRGLFRQYPNNSNEGARRMALLGVPNEHEKVQLEAWWEMIDLEDLPLLSREQLTFLNFTTTPIYQEKFNALFPPLAAGIPPQMSRIQELSIEQVKQCWRFFDETRLKYLTNNQLYYLPPDLVGARSMAKKVLFGGSNQEMLLSD